MSVINNATNPSVPSITFKAEQAQFKCSNPTAVSLAVKIYRFIKSFVFFIPNDIISKLITWKVFFSSNPFQNSRKLRKETPLTQDVLPLTRKPLRDVLNAWVNADPIRQVAADVILNCIENKTEELDLQAKDLTSLPDVFDYPELNHLIVVNLNHNNLIALPESFCQLAALQELCLKNNKLTALSDFSKLTALRKLDLSSNNLSVLPNLSQLKALRHLDLSNNSLSDLPHLSQLKALQYLDLSNNSLSALPDFFRLLTALRTLNLRNNSLSALPDFFRLLTALQILNLSNNNLSALPNLSQLKALQVFGLRNNKLTALPDSFGQLAALRHLDLRGNKLTALPDSFHQLTALKDLQLENNPLTVRLY